MITLGSLLGTLFVQPMLVLGAAGIITACIRRRTAAARHAVWAGAILATLALPAFSRVLPPIRLPTLLAGFEGSLPMPAWLGGSETAAVQPPPAGFSPGDGSITRVAGANAQERVARVMLTVWILGVLLLAARRVAAEVRMRRIVRRARIASDPEAVRCFAEIARSSGLRRPVQLRVTDEITSPAVAGVLRPVVLLPAAVSWTEAELAPILIHELGHVRRWDCLLNLLADLARAVHWCNPVAWIGVRRMRSESERACDDLVLRQGTEPEGYAHLLLRLARAARLDGGLPSAAVAMARPRELESRLLAVLDPSVPRHALPRWMPPALAGLGLVLAMPAAAFTLHADAPQRAGPMAMEPDRRGDSLAGPASERVPFDPDPATLSRSAAEAMAGPDAALARLLVRALDHVPAHAGDLVRERAAWVLSQVRGGKVVEPLLEALDAHNWRVQAYAAWALAAAPDPRATDRLISLLAHPVWRLRAMAAFALRASGDPAAEAAMDVALTDPAWQVRVEAVQYLAGLGGPMRSERLRPRLGDRHVAVRLAAEAALDSH